MKTDTIRIEKRVVRESADASDTVSPDAARNRPPRHGIGRGNMAPASDTEEKTRRSNGRQPDREAGR